MRVLAAVDGAIARFEAFVLALGVILMALNSIANVFGRFVFAQSIYFSEELNQILSHHCGRPVDQIARDTERDNFLTSQQAVEYGLIDQVITRRSGPLQLQK